MKYAADLELARRCAAGDETAWERFVREYRPILYRAARTLDPTGGARELADSLYADLYGVSTREGEKKRSLFHYFQGRSSLATWLRAVLVQRYIDGRRVQRRLEPLPDRDSSYTSSADRALSVDPVVDASSVDRARYVVLVREALSRAVARLLPRDRLRLACYYVQELTLAQTGRLLTEHEATVSRQLARSRQSIRESIEADLRDRSGLNEAQIAECFAYTAEDPGPIDVNEIFNEPDKPRTVTRESASP